MHFFWHSHSTEDKIKLEDKVIFMVDVNYSCIGWNSLTGQKAWRYVCGSVSELFFNSV